jgi:hypothetical protein
VSKYTIQKRNPARYQWLIPEILATCETQIGRIKVPGKTPSQPVVDEHSGVHLSAWATQEAEIWRTVVGKNIHETLSQ